MAEGAGGRLDALEVVEVRVHAEAAADLIVFAPKLLLGIQTLVHKDGVEHMAAVALGEDEAVAVGGVDLFRRPVQKIVVERYGHFHHGKSAAHVAVTDVLRGDDDVLAELLGLGLQTRKAFVCIAHA